MDRLSNATGDMKTSPRSFENLLRPMLCEPRRLAAGSGLRGERRCVTTLFSDIVSFTSVAEGMSPEEPAGHLREYLSVVSDAVALEEGTVDKFIGDAVMAIWGVPAAMENHALAALPGRARGRSGVLRSIGPNGSRRGLPEFRGPPWDQYGRCRRREHRQRHAAELHGDRRRGEPGEPPGGAQQGVRHSDPALENRRDRWRGTTSSPVRSTGSR